MRWLGKTHPDLKAIYTANDGRCARAPWQAVSGRRQVDARHRHERRAAGVARCQGWQDGDDDRAQSGCCGASSASTWLATYLKGDKVGAAGVSSRHVIIDKTNVDEKLPKT